MPRRKDQDARRGQVAEAAARALARRGASSVRVADVAAEAGLSPATVMYYYPTRADLIRVAFERALHRFVDERQATIEALPDPPTKLLAMIDDGFPTGADDTEVIELYTGIGVIRDDPELRALVLEVTRRQVVMYRDILVAGAADGSFRLGGDAWVLARNLVALEDAYGLYAVGGGTDVAEGRRNALAYAELAVGGPLERAPAEQAPTGTSTVRRRRARGR